MNSAITTTAAATTVSAGTATTTKAIVPTIWIQATPGGEWRLHRRDRVPQSVIDDIDRQCERNSAAMMSRLSQPPLVDTDDQVASVMKRLIELENLTNSRLQTLMDTVRYLTGQVDALRAQVIGLREPKTSMTMATRFGIGGVKRARIGGIRTSNEEEE